MTDTSRKDFEENFPPPYGIVYCNTTHKYIRTSIGTSITSYQKYALQWITWKRARASVVIELPKAMTGEITFYDMERDDYYDGKELLKCFEKVGITVK